MSFKTQKSIEDRFWEKVDKNGPVPKHMPELGSCWVWTASKNKAGYGKFGVSRKDKNRYSHRVSYTWNTGDIPPDKVIDHLCRNTSCVNPAHLEAVPHRTNTMRGVAPNVQAHLNGVCRNGHALTNENSFFIHESRKGGRPVRRCRECRIKAASKWRGRNPKPKVSNPTNRGAAHHSAKLDESKVIEIRKLHLEEKLGCVEISNRFRIAPGTASCIVLGKTWKHLLKTS